MLVLSGVFNSTRILVPTNFGNKDHNMRVNYTVEPR
jgi:hypothetical protein